MNLKAIIPSNKTAQSGSDDLYFNLKLDGNNRNVPYNDIHEIVSANDVYNAEKQSCTKYRIATTIKPYCTNVLFNITGTSINDTYNDQTSYFIFDKINFRDQNGNNKITDKEDFTYLESINNYLSDSNGWLGFVSPSTGATQNCQFIDLMPSRKYFDFVPRFDNQLNKYDYNWETCITYPAKIDATHSLVKNGIIIGGVDTINYGGRDLILIKSPIKHGLYVSDSLSIKGTLNGAFDGIYKVISSGDTMGNYNEYYFVLDYESNTLISGNTFSDCFLLGQTTFKRIYSDTESKYYFRIFKKIDAKVSYDAYPLAFGKNVYNDRLVQIIFNDDIDVSQLTDYMNRPLSKLYLSIIKTNTNNNLFSPIKAGINAIYLDGLASFDDLYDIHRIHNRPDFTQNDKGYPTLTNNSLNHLGNSGNTISNEYYVSDTDEYFYGDIVEWNDYEQIEKVLCDVNHRFNTNNRDYCDNTKNSSCNKIVIQNGELVTSSISDCINTGYTYIDAEPRVEGYYYKPHYEIEIRKFSSTIEQGDSSVTNIPEYAIEVENGLFLWKDLNDIGYVDTDNTTVDYPFLNNSFYLYYDINFYLKRQDPFGYYGLIYDGFPNDIYGEYFDTSNLEINLNSTASNGC